MAHRRKPEKPALPVPSARSRTWLMAALLLAATLFAYSPSLRGGLIIDDAAHVTPSRLQSLDGLRRIWTDVGAVPQYYPILHSAFWLEHRIWGDALVGYHLANVFLHAAAGCLLALILLRLEIPGAWLAAFLFALHPVCVESVAWISEQKSTLSAFFYLASFLAYLGFDRTRRKSSYLVAFALFALALMSKTVTATLPGALLVVLWWQRGRLGWKRDVLPLLPWFAIGAAAGLFTAWVERTFIGAEGPEFALRLGQHFLLAGRIVWFYLGKLLWPADLTFLYPRWTVDPAVWTQYLFPLGIVALAAGLVLAARRSRGPLAGFLFFTGTLFPVLGFLDVYPFRYSYVADHYQYLASLGILVPFAAGITIVAKRYASAPGVLPVFLGVLAWNQSAAYRDADTLYAAILARNPDCWLAHNNLGRDLIDDPSTLPEGIAHLEAALRLKSTAQSHNNLGLAFAKMPGRLPDAIAEYRAALQLEPGYTEAHDNLAKALMSLGRPAEAISEFEIALRTMPDDARTHNNLGIALATTGRVLEALAQFDTAVRLDPGDYQAHYNRGLALSNLKRPAEAVAEFEAALRIKPDDPQSHAKLGYALLKLGRSSDAATHFEASLRLRPDPALSAQLQRLRP